MADTAELLTHLVQRRASSVHLKAGAAPFFRIGGRLQASDLPPMTPDELEDMAASVLPSGRNRDFQVTGEIDFAIGVSGVGRFRVSIIRQRGSVGIVFRRVLTSAPTFEALGLPIPIRQLSERRRGLILVTGPADSGKSTTIASMIDHINEHETVSILTIEDPIEILHADKKAFISQREVATDTTDHKQGLRRSLRHEPDVVYIDHIPDAETMDMVLGAASGRLVISTLPSLNATETIANIVDFFPSQRARQTRHVLASVLQGIVSQRLLDREDGKGRAAVFELMVSTPRIHDAIVEAPGSQTVESLIEVGDYYGMQTIDQHLVQLVQNRIVSPRDALSAAVHPQELRVILQQSAP